MPSSRCRVDGVEETRRDNMIYALPVAHRQQATEQHDGVDVAEQRASSQLLLDCVEDGSLADVRLEARDATAHAPSIRDHAKNVGPVPRVVTLRLRGHFRR